MIARKVAMLGMWGVGKTSLVRRFIDSMYDEKYHATLGVKVDKKLVQRADGGTIKLMLWDIAGAENHFSVPMHYVRGAAGYLLVVDGTRRETLARALDLVEAVETEIGKLPFVTLVNKCDLPWETTLEDIEAAMAPFGCAVYRSSAKTGENVETAFAELAAAL